MVLVEALTENIYNELGQLESRNIGNGIQSIKNEYNIRGALTKMNDPKNLLNKLFGFELKYINPSGTSKSTMAILRKPTGLHKVTEH